MVFRYLVFFYSWFAKVLFQYTFVASWIYFSFSSVWITTPNFFVELDLLSWIYLTNFHSDRVLFFIYLWHCFCFDHFSSSSASSYFSRYSSLYLQVLSLWKLNITFQDLFTFTFKVFCRHRLLICFLITQTQNNHTETILIPTLFDQCSCIFLASSYLLN